MNGLALLLAATLGTGGPPHGDGGLGTNPCPAETPEAHRIAMNLASDPNYAPTRARALLPQVTATDVRLLADATDAEKCTQMLQNAQYRAVAWGGTLADNTPVFYQAGNYFFAVMTNPPKAPLPPAPQGYVNVQLGGWVAVYIFDTSLSVWTVVMM